MSEARRDWAFKQNEEHFICSHFEYDGSACDVINETITLVFCELTQVVTSIYIMN